MLALFRDSRFFRNFAVCKNPLKHQYFVRTITYNDDHIFQKGSTTILAVESNDCLSPDDITRLSWLFGEATPLKARKISGTFVGPRKEMITPRSTNAVEMAANMGVAGISRIEQYEKTADPHPAFDPMLQNLYLGLDKSIFTADIKADEIIEIEDIEKYNSEEGLALSSEEVSYLKALSERLGRRLTDSEVFGFSQVNSEHCRHKIFNGRFIIDGKEMQESLFSVIKKTSKENPNSLVSAYKDNVAFVEGPKAMQFAPANPETADFFEERKVKTVISLKAETHNFPTTVEPFNGAATGTGGEIRDRLGEERQAFRLPGLQVSRDRISSAGRMPQMGMRRPACTSLALSDP